MLFLNIIIAVKFGRKLVAVYHVHYLYTKKVVEFFFSTHFKSRLSLIVQVNVVLNRTVVVDSD